LRLAGAQSLRAPLREREARSAVGFAFEPKAVGELAHQRLGEKSSPQAKFPYTP
jgi:hypothetical protein